MPKPDKKIDTKYDFKVYLKFLGKYKVLFIGLIFLILVISALNLIDSYLFKIIIDKATAFSSHTVSLAELKEAMLFVLAVFAGLAIFKSTGQWFRLHLINVLDADMIADIKRKYFNHIITLSHEFHTTHKSGSLISRLGRGANGIEGMNDVLALQFAPFIFQLLLVGISIAYFDLGAGVAMLIMSVVSISFTYILNRKQDKLQALSNEVEDMEKAVVGDLFANIDSIKYFTKEKSVMEKFHGLSENSKKALLSFWNYYRWMESGQAFLVGLGSFLLIYFPVTNFMAGKLSLGTLAFIFSAYSSIIGPLFGFVWGIRNFYRSLGNLDDLFQYGKLENEIKDKPD